MTAPAAIAPPLALLAELTHRCPLQCPYCSNPLRLEHPGGEMDTDAWKNILDQAAAMGVLQVHFSGGEPMAREDLIPLVEHATKAGLYANLITSGVLIDEKRIAQLAAAGLDHVQISFQDTDAESGDKVAAYPGAHEKKLRAARLVRDAGLALTVNAVMYRGNLDRVEDAIAFAADLGAARLEVANVQYYGWGLKNRAALIPTRAQMDRATAAVTAARERYKGVMVIDYVIPDYYAKMPKSCMGGWGRQFVNISPSGRVLPCHAAETIPGLTFESARETPLAAIWAQSEAFNRFRGTAWMPEPCSSCERREIDWGGCRCQALALASDAAAVDPACGKAANHATIVAMAETESAAPAPAFVYRRMGKSPGL